MIDRNLRSAEFMKTIGELLQEALDLSDRNLYEAAFVPVCDALSQTAQKVFTNDNSGEPSYQKYIRENWRLISFIGVLQTKSLPLNLPFGLRRAIASFNTPDILEKLVISIVRQTLTTRHLPFETAFNNSAKFKVDNDKLLLPRSLFYALLGTSVLHPANKNETIPDNYWINIRDFKMFISELWGRADLAERVMKIYSKP